MKTAIILLVAALGMASAKMPIHVCPCPYIYAPVCGSNGRTYPNKCMFECESEQLGGMVTIAHDGKCDESAVIKMAFVGYCNENWEPVCGTDGKTYANPCHLSHASKFTNGLTTAYNGECKADKEREEAICGCDETWSPVCGSDGKTYTNGCQLQCAKQRTNADLTMKHMFPCNSAMGLVKREVSPCRCPKIYRPVCGSDSHTYGNLCTFNCQLSVTDGLTLSHFGEC